MEEKKRHRSYDLPACATADRQFKEEAVRLVVEWKRPVVEAARGLGYMRICCVHGNGNIRKIHTAVLWGRDICELKMRNSEGCRKKMPI